MNESRVLQAFLWLLAVAFVALALAPLRKGPPTDAASFYIAGHLAATGQAHRLYDPAATMESWDALRPSGLRREDFPHDNFFIRPPFAAYLYAPLTLLSFDVAWKVFLALTCLQSVLIVWLFPRWFQRHGNLRSWRPLLLAFLPFVWAKGLSQDTVLLTLVLGASLHLILKGRQWSGGALAALLLIKPHLAWAMLLAFFLGGKRKAALAFALVAAALAAVSFVLVGLEGIAQWRELVGSPRTDMFPYTMHNIRAVWIRIGVAPAAALLALVSAATLIAFRYGDFEMKIGAGILAPLLLSPHTYTQDLALLALLPFLTSWVIVRLAVFLPWMYIEPFRSNRNWPVIGLCSSYLLFLAWRAWKARPAPPPRMPSVMVNPQRVAHGREAGY